MVAWEVLGEVTVSWELLGEVTVSWELLREVFARYCCREQPGDKPIYRAFFAFEKFTNILLLNLNFNLYYPHVFLNLNFKSLKDLAFCMNLNLKCIPCF
jgi:hypothetical protein